MAKVNIKNVWNKDEIVDFLGFVDENVQYILDNLENSRLRLPVSHEHYYSGSGFGAESGKTPNASLRNATIDKMIVEVSIPVPWDIARTMERITKTAFRHNWEKTVRNMKIMGIIVNKGRKEVQNIINKHLLTIFQDVTFDNKYQFILPRTLIKVDGPETRRHLKVFVELHMINIQPFKPSGKEVTRAKSRFEGGARDIKFRKLCNNISSDFGIDDLREWAKDLGIPQVSKLSKKVLCEEISSELNEF